MPGHSNNPYCVSITSFQGNYIEWEICLAFKIYWIIVRKVERTLKISDPAAEHEQKSTQAFSSPDQIYAKTMDVISEDITDAPIPHTILDLTKTLLEILCIVLSSHIFKRFNSLFLSLILSSKYILNSSSQQE